MAVFLSGGGCGNSFADLAPEFVAALYTTAILCRIQGFVVGRLPAHPTASRLIFSIIGIVMAVNERFERTKESFFLHNHGS
jgi:hypothetical protein